MAKTVYSYEETVERYGKNSKKKIGGWIALIVIGVLCFFGGLAMIIVGPIKELWGLFAVGMVLFTVVSIPLIILGIVFTVLNSVKRGVARNKIKKAEAAHKQAE